MNNKIIINNDFSKNYYLYFTTIINGKLEASDTSIRTLISSGSEHLDYLNISTQIIEINKMIIIILLI